MKRKFYLLPAEYASELELAIGSGRAIDVEDFAIGLDPKTLDAFPDFESFQLAWLGSWKAFFDKRLEQQITQKEIFVYCQRLVEAFSLDLEQ